jgi:hypothetical protein
MNDEMIIRYITDVIQAAKDAQNDVPGELRDGKLLAYNEVLSMLKTDLTSAGPENYGLDFDIDTVLA